MTAVLEQLDTAPNAAPSVFSDDEVGQVQYFQQIGENQFELRVIPDDVITRHAARVAMIGVDVLRDHEKQWRPKETHLTGRLTDVRDENGELQAVRFENPHLMIAALSIHYELGRARELASDARGAVIVAANDLRLLMAEQDLQSPQSVLE